MDKFTFSEIFKNRDERTNFLIALVVLAFFGWLIYHLGFSRTQIETAVLSEQSTEGEITEDTPGPVIDLDGDGLVDRDDACPTVPGKRSDNGCPPDTDGDGIFDDDDECPSTAGVMERSGCPEIKLEEDEKATLELAVKTVQFETNLAKIRADSYPILTDILDILKKYPDYHLHIEGHTDNQGPATYNLQLSKDRAAACVVFFKNGGISASRLNSNGYGETRPIASNNTREGRANNRRVEFELFK